jgi:poly-gamma-glutamate synthesis protein (capsule biosynthesis protein)
MNRSLALLIPVAVGFVGYLAYAGGGAPAATLRAIAEVTSNPKEGTPIQILFTGDLMLDRGVHSHALTVGDDSLFTGVKGIFAGIDAVVPNLEGTITSNPSISEVDHTDLRFTFDPHYAAFLKSEGVAAVSLSNNHTDDFGTSGYLETKRDLDAAGIISFGSPANDRDYSGELTLRGKKVCFVGYEGFIHTDPAPIATEIAHLRPDCAFLVATMHAGEEYSAGFTQLQEDAAHAFIDAGADVVIGTHPHVVEPLELYKGKPIFYSLGNFLFDQDFSWATMHGLAVRVTITGSGTQYTLLPVTISGQEVKVTDGEVDIDATLHRLVTAELPEDIASAIMTKHSFEVR